MKTNTTMVVVFAVLCAALVGAIGAVSAKSRENSKLRAENASLQEASKQLNSRIGELLARAKQGRESAPVAAVSSRKPAPETRIEVDSVAEAGLKDELTNKDRELEALRAKLAEARPQNPQRDQRQFGDRMQAYWDKLKQDNPEEYARIQEERRQRNQEMADMTRERSAFLKAVPTEGLSQEYLDNHRALVEKMEILNQAMTQIAADPDSQASQALRHQMFTNTVGMAGMMKKERELLLNDMAQDLGYKPPEASNFVKYINYVQEVTSPPHGIGHGRGGGGPPGGK